MWNPVCEDIKLYKELPPMTPMEALEVLLATINGTQHSWEEVNRAKELLKGFINKNMEEIK